MHICYFADLYRRGFDNATLNFRVIYWIPVMMSLPSDRKKYFRHARFQLYLRLRSYSPYFRLPLAWLPFEVTCTNLDRGVRVGVHYGCRGHSYFHTKTYDFTGSTFEGRERGFFRVLFSHAYDASRLGKCCDFSMFAKALGKLCKRRDSHNTLRDVKGVAELRERSKCDAASDRRQHL